MHEVQNSSRSLQAMIVWDRSLNTFKYFILTSREYRLMSTYNNIVQMEFKH